MCCALLALAAAGPKGKPSYFGGPLISTFNAAASVAAVSSAVAPYGAVAPVAQIAPVPVARVESVAPIATGYAAPLTSVVAPVNTIAHPVASFASVAHPVASPAVYSGLSPYHYI